MTQGKTHVFEMVMVKTFVGAVVDYDVTMHLYLLWKIWSDVSLVEATIWR